jgi:hypothetical protein
MQVEIRHEELVERLALESWAQRIAAGITSPSDDAESVAVVGISSMRALGFRMSGDWDKNLAMQTAKQTACWALRTSRPEVVGVADDVAALVDGMVVGDPPPAPPALLADAFLVRTRCSGDLVPGVRAVWGYGHPDGSWVVGVIGSAGFFAENVRVRWSAPSFDACFESTRPDASHRDHVLPAFRWVVALGLLLDARGTPIESVDTTKTQAIIRPRQARRLAGMRYRTIRVSKAGAHALRQSPGRDTEQTSVDGLVRRSVQVRSFLRRQACGPGLTERRWVFIREHASSRWVSGEAAPLLTTVRAVDPG